MEKEIKKQDYLAPTLKVVEFKVERGFATSAMPAQMEMQTNQVSGLSEYQASSAESWF